MKFIVALLSFIVCAGIFIEPVFAKGKKDKSTKNPDKATVKKTTKKKTAKKAICPRGLEDQDIRTVFKGFSYEGFQKFSAEGDMDLMNGLVRKPWGFYKGIDGVHYAVYGFKPEPTNVASIIDTNKLASGKMLRIKIPEYCALYTEVSGDDGKSDQNESIGLVISRATIHKPKPLDLGAVKTEEVRQMIKKGLTSSDDASSSDENAQESATQKDDSSDNNLKRGKEKGSDAFVDSSEAKIFEKLNKSGDNDDESADGSEKSGDGDDASLGKPSPDKDTLDGNVAGGDDDEDTENQKDDQSSNDQTDDGGDTDANPEKEQEDNNSDGDDSAEN